MICKAGFEKVAGRECLYKHVQKGLFLSVYVDELKIESSIIKEVLQFTFSTKSLVYINQKLIITYM